MTVIEYVFVPTVNVTTRVRWLGPVPVTLNAVFDELFPSPMTVVVVATCVPDAEAPEGPVPSEVVPVDVGSVDAGVDSAPGAAPGEDGTASPWVGVVPVAAEADGSLPPPDPPPVVPPAPGGSRGEDRAVG